MVPAMCGNATLTMVVSSTSMNAASVTATAINQGLPAGRQSPWVFWVPPRSRDVHDR
jgi:hypothetical protein